MKKLLLILVIVIVGIIVGVFYVKPEWFMRMGLVESVSCDDPVWREEHNPFSKNYGGSNDGWCLDENGVLVRLIIL